MSSKSVGRIYLRRENDIIHVLSIKSETRDGSLYISVPVNEDQKQLGISNVKSSYHPDGQTHLTVQVPELGKIDDNTKRSMTDGMGYNGKKVYLTTEKNTPFADIDNVVKIDQGMAFKDINSLEHDIFRIVSFDDVKWGSEIIDTKKYKNISFNYYLVPNEKMKDASVLASDEYCKFSHPSLDLTIVVRVFDFWKD